MGALGVIQSPFASGTVPSIVTTLTGDGGTVEWPIPHAFGHSNFVAECYAVAAPSTKIDFSIDRSSSLQCLIAIAPPLAIGEEARVVLIGVQ